MKKAPQNNPRGKRNDATIISNLPDKYNINMQQAKTSKAKTLQAVQLLNSADLMAMLNIGKSAFYQMKSEGRLPKPVKIGTIQRWRLADIERWLNAGCPTAEKFEALRKAGAK